MTIINICSVSHAMPSMEGETHGESSPPEKRSLSRSLSTVPIGWPRLATPFPKPSSVAEWSGLRSFPRLLASLKRKSRGHADTFAPSLLSGLRNYCRNSDGFAAHWDSYRQKHARVDLRSVHRSRYKRNTRPHVPLGQVGPDLPA